MAGKFAKVPENTFDELQVDAGILLKNFDPITGDFKMEDIICATTGGITVTCTHTYSDYGEDVDNCPTNMLEFKRIDNIECSLGFTALGTSPELLALALGAADIDGSKITPRMSIKKTDFKPTWFVGDKADGGYVAVKVNNALSTGGLSLQTTKAGKGQIAVTLTGHFSIDKQDVVPMEFYSTTGTAEGGTTDSGSETQDTMTESEVNEDETF